MGVVCYFPPGGPAPTCQTRDTAPYYLTFAVPVPVQPHYIGSNPVPTSPEWEATEVRYRREMLHVDKLTGEALAAVYELA